MVAGTHTAMMAPAHVKLLYEADKLLSMQAEQLDKHMEQLDICRQHLLLCMHMH